MEILVLADQRRKEELGSADYVIQMRSGLSEQARGPLFMPILQLLAYYRAIAKGLDPDRLANLEAVVTL